MKKILTEVISDLNIYLTLEKEEKEILLNSILNDLNLIKLSVEKNHSLLRSFFKCTLKYLLFLNEGKDNYFKMNKEINLEKIFDFLFYTTNIQNYHYDRDYYFLNLIFQLRITEFYYFPIDEENTIEEYYKSVNNQKLKIKRIEDKSSNSEVDFIVAEYKKDLIYREMNINKINISKETELSKLVMEEIYKIYYKNKENFLNNDFEDNKHLREIIEENYGLSLFLILNIYKKIIPFTNSLKKERNKYIKKLMYKKLKYSRELINLNEQYYKSSCYSLLIDNNVLIEEIMFMTFSLNQMEDFFNVVSKQIKFINFLLLNETNKTNISDLVAQKEDYLLLLKLVSNNKY